MSSIALSHSALEQVASHGSGEFSVNLFGQHNRNITLQRISGAGSDFDARGSVVGEAGSSVFLVRRGDITAATISAPRLGTFTIVPDADGGHVLKHMDDSQHGGRNCGMIDDTHADIRKSVTTQVQRGGECSPPVSALIGYPADAGIADMMVYYTPAARLAAGGVSQINAQIDLAVMIANTAYNDSDVDMQIRVIRKSEINYVESTDAILNLNRLVNPADGFLDQVYPERDQFGGDLVSLWVDNVIGPGGVAYYPWAVFPNDNGQSGFSVMRVDNAPFETLAHEVGHNYGCAHDRASATDPGWYPFSYGFKDPSVTWKTIMASAPGTTVYYFSNPNLTYTGPLGHHGPLGVPGEDPLTSCDNARTHNLNGFTIANFRPSTATSPPSRVYVRASAAPGGNGTTWATAYKDLQDGLGFAARARGATTEVWVAAGTYKPDKGTANREWHFRPVNGVTLYGGFAGNETQLAQRNIAANPTILSGDIGAAGLQTDNSYHVVRADFLSSTAVLDGFVVRDGYADSQNWPHHAGAGVFVACSSAQFRNCTIENNYCSVVGAGAYVEQGQPQFNGCTFRNNQAEFSGGGAHVEQAQPQFANCVFRTNAAEFGGGAEHVGAAPTYTNCDFIDNTATGTGGGLNLNASSATVTNCHFDDNHAESGAAVRSLGDGASVFRDCSLLNNDASFAGGAIQIDGNAGMITIERCNFTTNSAGSGYGGALLGLAGAAMIVRDCNFAQNSAGFAGGGATISGCTATLERCRFTGNTAQYGAGLWNTDPAAVTLTNCGFFGNTAEFGGGAAHNTNQIDPLYYNCVFSGNRATVNIGGAAFDADQSDPTYINCTFYGNTAGFGGGAVWADGGTSTLRNCIVYNNSAAQLGVFNGGSVVATYSIVQGGFAGTGNLSGNPAFLDADGADNMLGTIDDDYRLNAGSPGIDSGNNTVVPQAITLDYAGLPRFANDPAVPDTGVGDARPRIDRGVHERPQAVLLGDMNCNGAITVGDIAGFVLALTNPAGYTAQFPNCNINNADINQNGVITVGDIGGFVALLTGG